MGKRQRRIRAHGATGQVAGAANEKAGSKPIAQTGLPNMRSPKKPLSQSGDRNHRPGRGLREAVSCPEERQPITWGTDGRLKRSGRWRAFVARGLAHPCSVVGVSLSYHFNRMGDIGKPIRETERPAPVRVPVPEPEPQREAPPPQREPEPVQAQRA